MLEGGAKRRMRGKASGDIPVGAICDRPPDRPPVGAGAFDGPSPSQAVGAAISRPPWRDTLQTGERSSPLRWEITHPVGAGALGAPPYPTGLVIGRFTVLCGLETAENNKNTVAKSDFIW